MAKFHTFGDVLRAFMSAENPQWDKYSPGTRVTWGRELRLAQERDVLGREPVKTMRPSVVLKFLDALSHRPGKQAAALAALKAVDKWAIPRDYLPRPITFGIRVDGPQGGHLPWTDAQVELGEAKARKGLGRAITLGANTGQRGSDLVKMLATDLETVGGRLGINVTQQKTGKVVWVPFTELMLRAIETWPRLPGPLLRKDDGTAWNRNQLSVAWLRERDTNPDLTPLREIELKSTHDKGLVMHGLRGTACVRLRRAGATIPQIADMVGMSEAMVARYCRFSLQRENALAAVVMLDEARERRNEKRIVGEKP